MAHPDIQLHFVPSMVVEHGRKTPAHEAFQGSGLNVQIKNLSIF